MGGSSGRKLGFEMSPRVRCFNRGEVCEMKNKLSRKEIREKRLKNR